ncbi:MAG: metal transporter, partial [Shewanella sp.]
IGHPSVPLNHPMLQVVILLLVFLPMRFCNLGAAVLALALAYSGWSPIAIILPLIAAPVLNIAQLSLMTWPQRLGLLAILALALLGAAALPLWFSLITLPEPVNLVALLLLAAIFAASLLRLGPRQFLRRLMLSKPSALGQQHSLKHKHKHKHSHEPRSEHSHAHSHVHSDDHKHEHSAAHESQADKHHH